MKTVELKIQARKQGMIALVKLFKPEAQSDELAKLSIDELYEMYLKLRA
jgi:hypothetical protein